MGTYTWNIVFMGMDLDYQGRENNDTLLQTIQTGIDIFKNDVEKSIFSNRLNITLLKFQSAKNSQGEGTAIIYKNDQLLGKNMLNIKKATPFNCLNKTSYVEFFSSLKKEETHSSPQKYIVIFLAHSFGAGFFPIKRDQEDYKYFTTKQLNETLTAGFDGTDNTIKPPLECFIGLNCGLQSVETNVIFQATTKYLISSQQPLPLFAISYRDLLSDLLYEIEVNGSEGTMKIGIDNEIIYSKFIYNCYSLYKKSKIYSKKNKKVAFDDFSLSLTRPPLIIKMEDCSKALLKSFLSKPKNSRISTLEKNIDNWTYASRFCMDPSLAQITNIVDAIQFFLKLRTFYEQDKIKNKIIEDILSCLRQTVCFNVTSSELCKTVVDFNNLMQMYIPYGLGMFLPKLLSANLLDIIKTFDKDKIPNISLSFANIIKNVAFMHQGNISYDERTKSLAEVFDFT